MNKRPVKIADQAATAVKTERKVKKIKPLLGKAETSLPFLSNSEMEGVLNKLSDTYAIHPMEVLTRQNSFKVLIACILSLRTKDETMIPASERLFAIAETPESLVKLTPQMIQQLIFPVGFYKTKSETILEICRRLIEDYQSVVPNTIDELLKFKGVGRKTANLVVGLGYGLPAICVDTHVHRISNRLGYLLSKTPEETEMILRSKLPASYWHVINKVMVLHGQQICKPIGARCDACPVSSICKKIDVRARKA